MNCFTWQGRDKCLSMKVDFEHAYDLVSWKFLEYMMVRMGFGEKGRRWMEACICTNSISILVKGNPIKELVAAKGLW